MDFGFGGVVTPYLSGTTFVSLKSPDQWSGSCYNIKYGVCRKCNRVIDRYDLLTPRPSKFIGGFIFLLWGCTMLLGHEIEKLRIEYNIPIWIICNSLNLLSEQEYHRIVTNQIQLNVYQMIMAVSLFQRSLENVPNKYLQ